MKDLAPSPDPNTAWLTAGGEIAQLVRHKDWAATPLGPIEHWPQSLKTSLGIMLHSRHPMFVFWGPQLVKIYNDAYRPITGSKHPWALGRPGHEVWPEIWSDIKPLVDRALAGDPTWSDDLLLFMERNGFPEEVYFTFSYSPVPDETGGVGGMFCACTETTGRVLGDRRLRTLRDLAAAPAEARTVADACTKSAEVLAVNPADVPFALLYLAESDGTFRLSTLAGAEPGDPIAPAVVGPDDAPPLWPLVRVAETRGAEQVASLGERVDRVPAGPWPEPPASALVLPLIDRGLDRAAGALVLGISSRRPFDREYREWFELVAAQIGTSISNARAVEEERRRAEALAELDRAKTAFFSNVSHEFRTPLTLLLGPLEDALAERSALGGEALETAHRNALRLLKLVNTLLDFSRIEAGRAVAQYEPTDLSAITTDLASVFRAAIEKAGLTYTVDATPLDAPVFVDRDMWEKIVLNLLSNAFKYTFAGEIRVTLRSAGHEVELSVRDTGIGIAAGDLPRVFDRFHRVSAARGRTHEGTGIGLALVKELVALHGGRVEVDSTPGEGSTFRVYLPFGTSHLPADRIGDAASVASTAIGSRAFVAESLRWLPADASSATAPVASGSRIALVDDNADMRDYVARLLGPHWQVDAYVDGEAALDGIRRHPPDLVLTDVMMPGIDGYGVLRAMRADAALREIPVILLSARAGDEARIEGLEAGADDYLVKPFGARELVARIGATLATARLRRESQDRIAAINASLRQTNRLKDEFLATLSHELRTPLHAILGWTHLLRAGTLDADMQARALDALDRSAKAQAQLVDDLLDVSRIIAGKLDIERAALDLHDVVASAIETIQVTAIDKRLSLVLDRPSRDPLPVAGDANRLRQVVWNLLTNAVKFTPAGGQIFVSVRRMNGSAEVVVRDTGQGITKEFLPFVFDRFRQADGTTTRRHGGLGLGLAIVRHLVEAHGGTVHVDSDGAGRGAAFTVRLPLAVTARNAAGAPATPAADRTTTLAGTRILIVDDEPDARDVLRVLLDSEAAQVTVATSAREALQHLRHGAFDVLLADIGMPGEDGLSLIRAIRSLPGPQRHLPAIAVTAYASVRERDLALAAGFDRHVPKPFDAGQLLAAVHSAVRRGLA